jgi:glucose-6-phosphate 1-epimerase
MPESVITPFYEVTGHIWTEILLPSYPIIHLANSHGTAAVALHGAHVISYIPTRQAPVIFTSKKAIFKEGKAIRGGIPICWPWFNAHPSDKTLPSHGYARNQFWKVIDSEHDSKLTSITLELVKNELQVIATITLGESLIISLTTTNLSDKKQTIGGALHSYFNVSNIEKISISGLEDVTYIDTLTETEEIQKGDIFICEETDRIYLNSSHTVSIYDPTWNRSIFIDKIGSQSTVIWNPWIDKSKSMADLGDDEYRNFVCVETANARTDVYQLAPNASHTLSTQITIV